MEAQANWSLQWIMVPNLTRVKNPVKTQKEVDYIKYQPKVDNKRLSPIYLYKSEHIMVNENIKVELAANLVFKQEIGTFFI